MDGTVLIEHCGKAYHPYERLRFGGAINAEDLIAISGVIEEGCE